MGQRSCEVQHDGAEVLRERAVRGGKGVLQVQRHDCTRRASQCASCQDSVQPLVAALHMAV